MKIFHPRRDRDKTTSKILYETGTRPRVSVLLVSRPRRDRDSCQSVNWSLTLKTKSCLLLYSRSIEMIMIRPLLFFGGREVRTVINKFWGRSDKFDQFWGGLDFLLNSSLRPRTRSWLCFPLILRTPTKIYRKEVCYRLVIWHLELTHKIKTRWSAMDGQPPSPGWSPTTQNLPEWSVLKTWNFAPRLHSQY